MLRLLEEVVDAISLIEAANQLTLQVVFDKVHEEVHDCLRHRVLDVLLCDEEVRPDESL